jgi:glutathione S-transferase
MRTVPRPKKSWLRTRSSCARTTGPEVHFGADHLTLADIALVAYIRWAHEADFDLANWPQMREWVRRIELELGLEASPASNNDASRIDVK